jgi:hypothetical protein
MTITVIVAQLIIIHFETPLTLDNILEDKVLCIWLSLFFTTPFLLLGYGVFCFFRNRRSKKELREGHYYSRVTVKNRTTTAI